MSVVFRVFLFAATCLWTCEAFAESIDNTEALVAAVRDGEEGQTIEIAEGTYELSEPLEPKPGMTIRGAGMNKTIITHVPTWKPSTNTLPDPEMKTEGMDTRAYGRSSDARSERAISGYCLRALGNASPDLNADIHEDFVEILLYVRVLFFPRAFGIIRYNQTRKLSPASGSASQTMRSSFQCRWKHRRCSSQRIRIYPGSLSAGRRGQS